MKPEDIIGKKIKGFSFRSTTIVSFTSDYEKLIGIPGVVLNINERYPEYANVQFELSQTNKPKYHYPVIDIMAILKKEDEEAAKPVDLDSLMKEILEKTQFVVK